MACHEPQYVIWVGKGKGDNVPMTAALKPSTTEMLRLVVVPNLRPLSDDDYMNGPAGFLFSMAAHVYVLHHRNVYWCVNWEPGVVVVRFIPHGDMTWMTIRSPHPEAGGRIATEAELDAFYDDEEDPTYDLIYDAWDAQFDPDPSKYGFSAASPESVSDFETAMSHVNILQDRVNEVDKASNHKSEYRNNWKRNLEMWIGQGVRMPVKRPRAK